MLTYLMPRLSRNCFNLVAGITPPEFRVADRVSSHEAHHRQNPSVNVSRPQLSRLCSAKKTSFFRATSPAISNQRLKGAPPFQFRPRRESQQKSHRRRMFFARKSRVAANVF